MGTARGGGALPGRCAAVHRCAWRCAALQLPCRSVHACMCTCATCSCSLLAGRLC